MTICPSAVAHPAGCPAIGVLAQPAERTLCSFPLLRRRRAASYEMKVPPGTRRSRKSQQDNRISLASRHSGRDKIADVSAGARACLTVVPPRAQAGFPEGNPP
jgi:hypothetical protein